MDSLVLGWIVSKVTGAPLSSYVRERIWGPAGMASQALVGHDYAGNTVGFCCYRVWAGALPSRAVVKAHAGGLSGSSVL